MDEQFTGGSDRDHSKYDFTPGSCRAHGLYYCTVCGDERADNGWPKEDTPVAKPEVYECKPINKEELNRVLNEHRKALGTQDQVFTAVVDPKEAVPDQGTPILSDLDKCWESIGKVFKEYATIDSDSFVEYLNSISKRKSTIEWSDTHKCKTIHVEGVATKIKYTDLVNASQALERVGASPKAAQKTVARIVKQRMSQLF